MSLYNSRVMMPFFLVAAGSEYKSFY